MRPAHRNLLLFSIVLGLALGVGFFTFGYARGASYLTDNPSACANCHIMDEHFDSWVKSSHTAVAVCNDCHTPEAFIPKYLTKASNGFWHAFAFTTGDFADPIRIKPHNLEVAESACRNCHADITAAITPGAHVTGLGEAQATANELLCTQCHRAVGHWVR